jgi:predicted enzyme related to lactoylglutathione lyase
MTRALFFLCCQPPATTRPFITIPERGVCNARIKTEYQVEKLAYIVSDNIKLSEMKKILLTTFALTASFGLGFALNYLIAAKSNSDAKMRRVTGIGGIFFKCKDPGKMREWYKAHLGLSTNQYGCVFEWRQAMDAAKKGFTQWSPFKETTKYFEPSTKEFMINYRVDDLTSLAAQLRKEGVTITDSIETYNYGKFVHILDAEGNKIELWEPNDIEYEKMGVKMGAETTK